MLQAINANGIAIICCDGYKIISTKKYIIKLIMFITAGPLDTSKSYEFTDWSKVRDFAKKLN